MLREVAEGAGSGLAALVGGCTVTWEETALAAEGYNLSTLFYLLIICCVDSLFLCPPSPGWPPASPPESASCCNPACWEPVRCWRSHVLLCYYLGRVGQVEGKG